MKTVIVKTFDNYFVANIILTRLQDAGVNCFLKDEYTVTIDPILSNAIGGIKLAVDEKDEAMVTEMLAQFDEEYRKAAVCPNCGKHEIVLVSKPGPTNVLTTFLTWLISSYAVSIENIYQCQNCKYESRTLPLNTAEYN